VCKSGVGVRYELGRSRGGWPIRGGSGEAAAADVRWMP
jgi:hypothetical protein